MNTIFVGVKELRQNMAKITEKAQKKHERIIVLKKNKPLFELRPLSKADALVESFALDIQEGLDDVKGGRVHSDKEIMDLLGIE